MIAPLRARRKHVLASAVCPYRICFRFCRRDPMLRPAACLKARQSRRRSRPVSGTAEPSLLARRLFCRCSPCTFRSLAQTNAHCSEARAPLRIHSSAPRLVRAMMEYCRRVFAVLPEGSRKVKPPEMVICPAPVCAISMRAPSGKATAALVGTVTVIAAALACSPTRWLSASARL